MTFVCNAGPVIALAKIDRLLLLRDLSSSVLIPDVVFHEVLAKPGLDASRILSASRSFLNVRKPPELPDPSVQFALRHLDAGEQAVIALDHPFRHRFRSCSMTRQVVGWHPGSDFRC